MAHKKAGGSSRNGRDSNPKYLGVKCYGGEKVRPGSIIVRQRGSKIRAGEHVGMGRDHTLYAKAEGKIVFLDRGVPLRKYVSIQPVDRLNP